MKFAFVAVLAALAVPAHAGGLRHHLAPASVLPPLYGGGYTPLACAATVFPAPRWCHCRGSPRAVSTARRARAAHRA
jgi:hypothetical protein